MKLPDYNLNPQHFSMDLFNVYPLFNITPVKGEGAYLFDNKGERYLDLYGGHAVISIGHSHPHYVKKLTEQIQQIGFYSNSVQIPLQKELADKLGALSGYNNYELFLCNSGAEANENALKLASFHNGKKKVIAFQGGFHGRTSLAVAATDNPSLLAPINQTDNIEILPFNDAEALIATFDNTVCAVIIEGIQGVGGVQIPDVSFLKLLRELCDKHNVALILDEVQSGYGRSGHFFAHQHANIKPDLITIAKGMGNGFPVAGVLIAPHFKAEHGMLGTTFGGNYMACAAAIAVLDVMKDEQLIDNARNLGQYLAEELSQMTGVKEVRAMGLMVGLELEGTCAPVRNALLKDHHIFTGSSSNKNTLRILPPLNVTKQQLDEFVEALAKTLQSAAIS